MLLRQTEKSNTLSSMIQERYQLVEGEIDRYIKWPSCWKRETIRTLVTCHKTQPLSWQAGHLQTPNPHQRGNKAHCVELSPVFRDFCKKTGRILRLLRQRWLHKNVQKQSGGYSYNTNATYVQHRLCWQFPTVSTVDSVRPPLCAITSAGGATANIAVLVPFPALGTQWPR